MTTEMTDYKLHPDLHAKATSLDLQVHPSKNWFFQYLRKKDDKLVYACQMLSMRCLYDKVDGRHQCKRATVMPAGFCKPHLRKLFGVEIKKSKIAEAGLGLYATRTLRGGDVLHRHKYCDGEGSRDQCDMPYWGQLIDRFDSARRYNNKTAPYGVTVDAKHEHEIDSACLRGFTSFINHKLPANCIISMYEDEIPVFQLLRDVQPGEELYIDYGKAYKFDDSMRHFSRRVTKTAKVPRCVGSGCFIEDYKPAPRRALRKSRKAKS